MHNIPEGWVRRRLGEVLDVQNGYAFASEHFTRQEGVPLIRIRDLKVGTNTEAFYSGPYDDRFLVQAGDLLIGMDGAFRCYRWVGPTGLLNQRVCRLVRFSPEVEPEFVLYSITQHLRQIERETSYSTVKHISAKQIKAIEIDFPPLEEQRRIVGRIRECVDRLDEIDSLLEQSLAEIQALIRSGSHDFVELPEVRYAPRLPLGDLGSITTGSTPPTRERRFYGGNFLWATPGDMSAAREIRDTRRTLTNLAFKEGGARLVPSGSVAVVCIGATIGKVALCPKPMSINQQINAVSFGNSILPEYGYWACVWLYDEIVGNAKTATLPILNKGAFSKLRIPVPPLAVQHSVVERLNELQDVALTLEANAADTVDGSAAIREAILRQAFAGEL